MSINWLIRKFFRFKFFGAIATILIILGLLLPKDFGTFLMLVSFAIAIYGLFKDENRVLSVGAIAIFILYVFLDLYKFPNAQKLKAEYERTHSESADNQIQLAAQKKINDSIEFNVKPFKKMSQISDSLNKTDYKNYKYYSAEDVLAVYNILKFATVAADKYEKSNNPKVVEEASKLRKLCMKKQKIVFPILRLAYAKVLNDVLWEDDIEVRFSGTTISFIGGKFAANRNIAEFHDLAWQPLYKLRYKKVKYLWYKYDEDYTSYSLFSGSDSDPILVHL